MSIDRPIRNGVIVLLSVVAPALPGCSRNAADAIPVSGTVAWAGGDLTGHAVEVARVGNESLRGYATIEAGGRFRVERFADGQTTAGLPAGTYVARLVLADEGDGQKKRPKVPAKSLDFKASGWTFAVPSAGDVTLTVAAK